MLVLDEPTNHLDLPAIEQLEEALAGYRGTLLLVTHDRRMLDAVQTTRRLEVVDGLVTELWNSVGLRRCRRRRRCPSPPTSRSTWWARTIRSRAGPPVPDVVHEQRLPGEAEVGEQRQCRALLGHDLDDELDKPAPTASTSACRASPRPSPVPRHAGDHQPDRSLWWTTPAAAGRRRNRSPWAPPRRLDWSPRHPPPTGTAAPAQARTSPGSVTSSLDEGEIASGSPAKKRRERVAAVGPEFVDGHSGLLALWRCVEGVAAPAEKVDDRRHGRPAAVRPTTRPMWPASRTSSCLSSEPTRSHRAGRVGGTMVAVAADGEERHRDVAQVHRVAGDDQPVGDHPVVRTSICAVSRAAAPGNGTWSSDQPAMAL